MAKIDSPYVPLTTMENRLRILQREWLADEKNKGMPMVIIVGGSEVDLVAVHNDMIEVRDAGKIRLISFDGIDITIKERQTTSRKDR